MDLCRFFSGENCLLGASIFVGVVFSWEAQKKKAGLNPLTSTRFAFKSDFACCTSDFGGRPISKGVSIVVAMASNLSKITVSEPKLLNAAGKHGQKVGWSGFFL